MASSSQESVGPEQAPFGERRFLWVGLAGFEFALVSRTPCCQGVPGGCNGSHQPVKATSPWREGLSGTWQLTEVLLPLVNLSSGGTLVTKLVGGFWRLCRLSWVCIWTRHPTLGPLNPVAARDPLRPPASPEMAGPGAGNGGPRAQTTWLGVPAFFPGDASGPRFGQEHSLGLSFPALGTDSDMT